MTTQKKCLVLFLIIISLVALLLAKRAISVAHAETPQESTPTTSTSTAPQVSLTPQLSLRQKVEITFADAPIMVAKLKCESGYRQFDTDGTILLSPTMDVGVGQINLKYHLKESQKMGLDIINSADDNLKFARHLYDQVGSSAWYAPSTPDCK